MKINIRQIGIFIVILSACIVIWLAATAATYRSLSQEASPASSTMSAPTPNNPTPTPVVTPPPGPDRSAFAGSIATTGRILRVTRETGIPLGDAVKMLTRVPAEIMGLSSLGRIAPGYEAVFTAFDGDLRILPDIR